MNRRATIFTGPTTLLLLGVTGCLTSCGDTATSIVTISEELCVSGRHGCSRLADGRVACWGSYSRFVLDVDATRLDCAASICVEDADGAIGCYDWDGEPESESYYEPSEDTLPFANWWLDHYSHAGGCGVNEDAKAVCWPEAFWFMDAFHEAAAAYDVRHIAMTEPCIMLTDTSGQIHSLYEGEDCAGHTEKLYDYGYDFWYDGTFGLENPPPGDDWQSVSAGEYHACALDSQGRATCWGLSADRLQPDPNLQFKQLDSARSLTCGVTTDGHIECIASLDDYFPAHVPTNDGWVQVAVSVTDEYGYTDSSDTIDVYACALDEHGQVYCFGDWDEPWPLLSGLPGDAD